MFRIASRASPRAWSFAHMYIIAIAWLYVTILMAVTETSFIAGVATFFFYGLGPLLLFWYVVGTPTRKARKRRKSEAEAASAERERDA